MFLCLKIVLKKEAQYIIVLYYWVVGHSNILCLWLLVYILLPYYITTVQRYK